MKRGGYIARYTPLAAKVPLPRSGIGRNAGPKLTAVRQRHTGPSPTTVAQVVLRDESCCVRCGGSCHGRRGVDWSVQHRRARGMGGSRREDTNSLPNLILLCGSATTGCHGWVESNRTAALPNGWALKSISDPSRVPVLHWQRGLIFLGADGSWSSRPIPTAEEATP